MNKKGVTLIELLVYIALFAVVSMFIGSQMKQLLGSYTNGRQISKLQSDSRDILAMMSRELRNTGLKTYLIKNGTNRFSTSIDPGAFMQSDSSSFVHKEGSPGDSLTIFKLTLNDNGDPAGVDTIQYFLNGTTLKRSAGGKSLDIAENVHALQFQYGVFAVDTLLMDQRTINPNDWSAPGATKTDSVKIAIPAYMHSGSIKCNKLFRIENSQRIRVSFQMTASGNYPANLDSIKCCIKHAWTNVILASESFLVNGSEIEFVIPVHSANSAYLSFDFLSHGDGELNIGSVEVRRADLGKYKWVDNPVSSHKKAVKALKIYAIIRSNGNAGVVSDGNLSIANVQIPVSGKYVWRVVKETVEVLNNGTF